MRPNFFLPEHGFQLRASVMKNISLCTNHLSPVQNFDTYHNRRTMHLQTRTPINVHSIFRQIGVIYFFKIPRLCEGVLVQILTTGS